MSKNITVIKNFGGRRCPPEGPTSVRSWGIWDCDPSIAGKKATRQHSYGSSFPWTFDVLEKAYVLEGTATLTPDDPAVGPAVEIGPRDMVTFPRGWVGRWEVHSFLQKRYAFFDGKGIQIDEDEDEDEGEGEGEDEIKGEDGAAASGGAADKGQKRAAEDEDDEQEDVKPPKKQAKAKAKASGASKMSKSPQSSAGVGLTEEELTRLDAACDAGESTEGVEVVMIKSLGADLMSSLGASYKTRYVCVVGGNVVVMPASKWVGKKVNTSKASDFHQIITAAVAGSRVTPDARGLVVLGEGMRICEQNCVPKLAELGIALQRR